MDENKQQRWLDVTSVRVKFSMLDLVSSNPETCVFGLPFIIGLENPFRRTS
jgi:hypothetical protein